MAALYLPIPPHTSPYLPIPPGAPLQPHETMAAGGVAGAVRVVLGWADTSPHLTLTLTLNPTLNLTLNPTLTLTLTLTLTPTPTFTPTLTLTLSPPLTRTR